MLKSLSKFKRQNKEKFKIPRYVQDIIPIDKVYKDGIFSVGKRYSKTYMFIDINYSDASGEDKKGILLGYGEMLNSLDASCTAKITILNRKVDPEEISNKILHDFYRDSYEPFEFELDSYFSFSFISHCVLSILLSNIYRLF